MSSSPEGSHRTGDRRGRPTLSVVILPRAKEGKFLASDSESKASKRCLHPSPSFPHGNSGGDYSNPQGRNVGSVFRPSGCVPPYLCRHSESEISRLQLQGSRVQVPYAPLRPLYRSKGFHPCSRRGCCTAPKARDSPVRLSRRLADPGSSQESSFVFNKRNCYPTSISRLGNQPQEIASNPYDGTTLLRGQTRLCSRQGVSINGKDSFSSEYDPIHYGHTHQSSSELAQSSGSDGQLSRRRTPLPPAHASNSDLPIGPLQAGIGGPSFPDPSLSFDSNAPSLVADRIECIGRDTVPGESSAVNDHNRCFTPRLGSVLRRRNAVRRLVDRGVQTPYQSPRVGSSCTGCQSSVSPGAGQNPFGLLRQHIRGRIHQQTRGNTLSGPVPESVVLPSLVSEERRSDPCYSHSRNRERPSGCLIERPSESGRVVSEPGVGQSCLPAVRETSCGHVCNAGKRKASDLLLEKLSSDGMEVGRHVSVLGRDPLLCVSSVQHDSQSSPQSENVQDSRSAHCSFVAETTLVPVAPPPSGGPSISTSTLSRPSVSGQGEGTTSSGSGPPLNCLETVRDSFRARGFPEDVAALAARSRRPSTLRTYDSRLSKFGEWCTESKITPSTSSVAEVASFLKLVFDEGKQVSTIKNYRSAIAAIHEGFPDGSTLGNNSFIAQLLRGMANDRPRVRSLAPTWSISAVLAALATAPYEPLHKASLADLTHKTLFLVAVASARRRSCLQALSTKPGHLRFENHGVRFIPDIAFLPKNQTLLFIPGDIFIPELKTMSSIPEDRFWCPVRALKWYLKRTEKLRSTSRLFIIPSTPYGAASRDTISRWLVEVISPHAQGGVRAHEVRGQAASRALFAGVDLQDILKAAAWKTPTTFVSCYLSDTLSAEASFGRAAIFGSSTSNHPPGYRC